MLLRDHVFSYDYDFCTGDYNTEIIPQYRLYQPNLDELEFFETICGNVSVFVCPPKELELQHESAVMRNTCASPMEFRSATCCKSMVTLRKCSLAGSDDETNDKRFIAKSVLHRDLDILK